MSDSIDYIDEVGREWTYAIRYRILADENAALRKGVEELEGLLGQCAKDWGEARDLGQKHLDRAEKAERERDELRRGFESRGKRLESLQADLDAALLVIEDLCHAERWLLLRANKDGRILALLEKRRKSRG